MRQGGEEEEACDIRYTTVISEKGHNNEMYCNE